jgi:hypothetical protein
MCERIVVNKGIEVHPLGESCRIGRESSAEQGHVKTAAVIDEVRGSIAALQGEAPGAEDWACEAGFSKYHHLLNRTEWSSFRAARQGVQK